MVEKTSRHVNKSWTTQKWNKNWKKHLSLEDQSSR